MQESFTRKTQEALALAQQSAQSAGHPELTRIHLAMALLAEPEGVTSAVLHKLDVDPKVLSAELAQQLEKLPRASGGQLAMIARAGGRAQRGHGAAEAPGRLVHLDRAPLAGAPRARAGPRSRDSSRRAGCGPSAIARRP
jgi:ATP-dependent Clp protease ATP-binding subunit ClpA